MPHRQPRLHHVTCPAQPQAGVEEHRMGVWEWGEEASTSRHVVVCVHGLTRQGRDFDVLARELLVRNPQLTVWCPDVVGRGVSDWLPQPMGYQIPVYVADVMHWLAQSHAQHPIARLDWLGTSMGGVMGLILAAQPDAVRSFPLSRLILNDVGPSLPWAFVERLRTYVGRALVFPSVEEGAGALRDISSGFGPHSDEDWLNLCRPMFKPHAGGGVELHYDPGIVVPIQQLSHEVFLQSETLLWSLYDQITCPTLLLRGQQSDVLTQATAQAMTQRGPRARLMQFPHTGHAPTLVDPNQSRPVLDWLLA